MQPTITGLSNRGGKGDSTVDGDPKAAAAMVKKKRRRRKKRPEVVVLDQRRPLEAMEVEQGQRLVEETPLSLRWRQYTSIFNRRDDWGGHQLSFSSCDFRVNGVQVSASHLCLGLAGLVGVITFLVLSAQVKRRIVVGRGGCTQHTH
jgi:hypothetical protein